MLFGYIVCHHHCLHLRTDEHFMRTALTLDVVGNCLYVIKSSKSDFCVLEKHFDLHDKYYSTYKRDFFRVINNPNSYLLYEVCHLWYPLVYHQISFIFDGSNAEHKKVRVYSLCWELQPLPGKHNRTKCSWQELKYRVRPRCHILGDKIVQKWLQEACGISRKCIVELSMSIRSSISKVNLKIVYIYQTIHIIVFLLF